MEKSISVIERKLAVNFKGRNYIQQRNMDYYFLIPVTLLTCKFPM